MVGSSLQSPVAANPAIRGISEFAMKALVYHGPGAKAREDVTLPELVADSDAIVRVDTTTIFGTDLHILKGDVPAMGRTMGHEAPATRSTLGASSPTASTSAGSSGPTTRSPTFGRPERWRSSSAGADRPPSQPFTDTVRDSPRGLSRTVSIKCRYLRPGRNTTPGYRAAPSSTVRARSPYPTATRTSKRLGTVALLEVKSRRPPVRA